MHIEPGIVEGPKIILSYLTAGGAGAYALSLGFKHIKERSSRYFRTSPSASPRCT